MLPKSISAGNFPFDYSWRFGAAKARDDVMASQSPAWLGIGCAPLLDMGRETIANSLLRNIPSTRFIMKSR